MSDPNKLAAKHTPAPWMRVKAIEGNLAVRCPGYLIATLNKPGHWSDQEERYAREMARYEADQHLINTSPDMVEFIADLMEFFDFVELLQNGSTKPVPFDIKPWRIKAEAILKKAYNF